MDFDVIIVGAGPAGSTLAEKLAQKGVRVALLEKEKLPRYKCCAGCLSLRAFKLLDPGVFSLVESDICGATFTLAGKKSYSQRDSRPLGYTVMRDKFDCALAKLAEKAGAVVLQAHEVKRIEMDEESVRVCHSAGELRSKFVVGADGYLSAVARSLDLNRKMGYGVAVQSEVSISETARDKWRSRIHLDLGRLPGYAWVFPKADHLSVGMACHRSNARHLKRHFQEFLNSLDLNSCGVVKTTGALIPCCQGKVTAVRGRALLLGDAAGLADSLTGEGIYNAVYSACLAAPVIEKALQDKPDRLMEYQAALEKIILPELRIANLISKVFYKLPGVSFQAITRDERLWRTGCSVLRGDTDYQAIKKRLNELGGIYKFLLHK